MGFQDCCHSGLLSIFISSHYRCLVFYKDQSDVTCLLAIPVNVSAHHCLSLTVYTELLQPPFSSSKLLSYFFLVGSFTRHMHLDAHWTSILVDLPLYTIHHDFKVLQRWLHYKSILNFISFPLNFMLLISLYLSGCYSALIYLKLANLPNSIFTFTLLIHFLLLFIISEKLVAL